MSESVQATNDDAAECKLSAVSCGYWVDEFVKHMVAPAKRKLRKAPLINRGHFARVAAVDFIIRRFIDQGGRQVVILGAGSDTSFLRIGPERRRGTAWFEIDLPAVSSAKAAALQSVPEIRAALGGVDPITPHEGAWRWLSSGLAVASADIADSGAVESVLLSCGADFTLPTLFVSEVVLVYVDPAAADALISWAASRFRTAVFATYEQIRPGDAFGATMVRNLEARGCPLLGIHAYPDLASQESRYTSRGWHRSKALDMNSIYSQLYSSTPAVAQRLASIEIFDELEEWNLIQAHYCVVVSVIDDQAGTFWGQQVMPRFVVRLDLPPLSQSATTRRILPLA